MKRALVSCLFFVLSANCGICATTYFSPLQPVSDFDQFASSGNFADLGSPLVKNSYSPEVSVTYPKIGQIEQTLFGQMFASQDILQRVSRIEKNMFNVTYPDWTLSQRVDNIVMNFNQLNEYPNVSKNILTSMESKVFRKNFAYENTSNRIERLEQQVFGAIQSGDMSSRYETLRTAVNNYKPNQISSNYPNPLATKTQGGWKGVLSGLGGLLQGGYSGGYMTGFTPPVDPMFDTIGGYNSGNNGSPNIGSPSGYGMYSGTRTNRGYSDAFSNYGSQSRVTILN